jgi:hypothetical protein
MKFKKDKTQTIKFRAIDKHVFDVREKPVPAASMLPDWYRDIPIYGGNSDKLILNPAPNVTVKKCFPILDSLTSGYIVKLWADCQVVRTNGVLELKWVTQQSPFDIWPAHQVSTFDIPEGYDRSVFKYMHGWIIKTPPGYSSIITHPFGYQNLPFRVISGVVDTDNLDTDINTPIVFNKKFEGIIEKGTPMFQVIPFKRTDWQAEYEQMEDGEFFLNSEKLSSTIFSSYGRNKRVLKRYK